MKNIKLMAVVAVAAFLCLPTASSQTTNSPDLDRDGIPNISDPDVDNDGIPNGSDRNIDGGTAKSGPMRGSYIGDRLSNDSPLELDMDADGLADNSTEESDIDGDGLFDGSKGEFDIDGDGMANGLDGDVDGDGLTNSSDSDMYGTGVFNDIFAGADAAYAPDATVASTIAFVSGEIRKMFGITAADTGLRVRVGAAPFGSVVTGVWRYLSNDNIQIYAKWCYPANKPSDIKLAVIYRYNGPYSGNPSDYTNPDNYSISEESRLYAQYPGGGITFVSWIPPLPAEFYFTAVFQNYTSIPSSLATGGYYYGTATQQAVDFAPPFQALVGALSSFPNLVSDPAYLSFSGNFGTASGLPSLRPVLNLQRTVMQTTRNWYGRLEARQIR